MIVCSARYYDGQTSASVDVTIEVSDTNVAQIVGPFGTMHFDLGELRIAPRLGNTWRKITLPSGAACESKDHDALDEMQRRVGRGKFFEVVHRLESSWRSAALATVFMIGAIVFGVRWGIPLLAKQIAAAIPARMAYDLGQGTLAMLDRTMLKPSQLASARRDELTAGFDQLATHYPELPLELNFRRGVGPNAFALPDGSVIVTDELVALAKNDQEIFSVLMHEIGHVHHRHALRMALESSTVLILVSTYLGDVTQLSTLSGTLPGIIAQSHYSRDHETEADTFALLYLERAHLPRKHFADILRALEQQIGHDGRGGLQYLASHPPTAERIRRFEQ